MASYQNDSKRFSRHLIAIEQVGERFMFPADHCGRTIANMTLKQSNPHLISAAARSAALRMSAQTSSAVEGIRAPFAKKGKKSGTDPGSTDAFIAHWKRRVAATVR